MIYICEKCGLVYKAEYQPTECETCGCTYIRKADEREVSKELKIKYILYNSEIIFDLEKEQKEHIEMDKVYFKGLRNIAKQLDEIGFPDGKDVAMYIMEEDKTKLELSVDEIETAKYILRLIGANGDARVHAGQIANGISTGCEEIKNVYKFLLNVGYSEEQLQKFYSKDQSAFCYKRTNLEKQFDYLEKIGLSHEQVLDVFLDTIYLGYDETKERCETVLKYFDNQMVYTLGKKYLFYGYYTDPVDGIEYIVEHLGVEKAEKLFLEQDMILYLWKEKYQRNDWTHGTQHKEAIQIINKYLE